MGSSNMLPLVQAYLCRVPAAMQRARCGKIIDRNIGGRVPKSRGGPHVAARPRRSRLWLVFDPCLYVDFLLLCVDGGNETYKPLTKIASAKTVWKYALMACKNDFVELVWQLVVVAHDSAGISELVLGDDFAR